MVPGHSIYIAAGSLPAYVVNILRDSGVEVVEYEPQEKTAEKLARWVSDVQAKQARKGNGKETRPPWIRKATGRAPRYLGPKGSQR